MRRFSFILSNTARCAGEGTRGGDTFSHFLGSSKVSPPQRLASVWRTCSGWVRHSAKSRPFKASLWV